MPLFSDNDNRKYAPTTPITAMQDGQNLLNPSDCLVAIAPIISARIAPKRKRYFILNNIFSKVKPTKNGVKYGVKESYG